MCSPTTGTPWRYVRCRLPGAASRSRFRWRTSATGATARSPSSGLRQPTRRRVSTSGPDPGTHHGSFGPDDLLVTGVDGQILLSRGPGVQEGRVLGRDGGPEHGVQVDR